MCKLLTRGFTAGWIMWPGGGIAATVAAWQAEYGLGPIDRFSWSLSQPPEPLSPRQANLAKLLQPIACGSAYRPMPAHHRHLETVPELVLASTSAYRRQLLAQLGLAFRVIDPQVDEQRLPGENAAESVERLARAKALAAGRILTAASPSRCLIIGSDQLSILGAKVLGKPGTQANARRQLQQASGHPVEFVTAIAVLDSTTQDITSRVIHNRVWFKVLSDAQIDAYLDREQPLDCAGSFKSEGLGIALFRRVQGDDPNALVGLPLIALCALLEAQGLDVLTAAKA